jgi:hypothetical protein
MKLQNSLLFMLFYGSLSLEISEEVLIIDRIQSTISIID